MKQEVEPEEIPRSVDGDSSTFVIAEKYPQRSRPTGIGMEKKSVAGVGL